MPPVDDDAYRGAARMITGKSLMIFMRLLWLVLHPIESINLLINPFQLKRQVSIDKAYRFVSLRCLLLLMVVVVAVMMMRMEARMEAE